MVSVLEWYLAELDSRLGNRLPESIRSGLLAEIRAHLESAAEDMEAQGHSREEAERVATDRFGRPSRIAWRLLETHAPRRSQPLSRWPVIWAFSATLWAGGCLAAGISGSGLLALKVGLPILLIAFLASSFQSRRARPWAIAGATATAFLVTWVFVSLTWLNLYMVGGLGQVPIWQQSQYRADVGREISRWNQELPKLRAGVAAFSLARFDPSQDAYRTAAGWLAPVDMPYGGWWTGPPVSGNASRSTVVRYQAVADWAEARRTWLTVGKRGLGAIYQTLTSEKEVLVALDRVHDVPLTSRARDFFIELAPPTVLWLLSLLVTNMVAVWIGELARWVRIRQVRIA